MHISPFASGDVVTIVFDRAIIRLRMSDFEQMVSLRQRAMLALQPQFVWLKAQLTQGSSTGMFASSRK